MIPILGGEDFDKRMINYLVDEFKKEQGTPVKADPLAMQRVKEAQRKSENRAFFLLLKLTQTYLRYC
ncbi:Hsp70 family protein [Vibrio lentus]|nr:Hsp70 family protein [Vibrio lentus]